MKKSKRVSDKILGRITKAQIQIKAEIGFEYCVCFLSHSKIPRLMISNIPRILSSGIEEEIIEKISSLFSNKEFSVEEQTIGNTVALIFTPRY